MKILYYNWVQFDDEERRGGGVTVYLDNIVSEMISRGHDVYFLSSGTSYDIFRSKSYVRKTKCRVAACNTYEIVNSSVMAPSHAFWGGEEISMLDESMVGCVSQFVEEHGPFDVVHFHNLEGLSLKIISKDIFKEAMIFHSAHNYFSICPQVNLWRYETANCVDYNDGQACTYCLPYAVSLKKNMLQYQTRYLASKFGFCGKSLNSRRVMRLLGGLRSILHVLNKIRYFLLLKKSPNPIWRFLYGRKDALVRSHLLRERRLLVAKTLIENNVTTLAVSEQTKTVLMAFGLKNARNLTSYIGTKHTDKFKEVNLLQHPKAPERLSICYLGYMRRDKGFYFFLECLEKLPISLSKRISVTVAAKNNFDGSIERLMKLNQKFNSVHFYDGFSSSELDDILKKVDLGVIPSLWEDNLPQVAIEIVSRGIPVLTSNLGGAQEISRNRDFTFDAGNHDDFTAALERLVDGKITLGEYWNEKPLLRSNSEHAEELERIYSAGQ
ncbi:glycosyltransferase involved in cell wall biosynthesis [Agrobacterium larrymoorei]|uniref:Glycosyltransferase involved in cell wall biosynthesis n=1 Tax=Agrobacterium larrymoorei TaxID=160699 RepID=A0AAJ2BDI3_9HYPH|nr:glycosyltransferase [Agrobacterium larrymoorei]MDR6100986.1 glycosyltransferase involved in cell wall biosynthesis [Agrobacterium larrymoorei]